MKTSVLRLILLILLFHSGFVVALLGQDQVPPKFSISKMVGEYVVIPKYCRPIRDSFGKVQPGMIVAFARPADRGMFFATAELDPIMTADKIHEIDKVVVLRFTILSRKFPLVVYTSKKGGIICLSRLEWLFAVKPPAAPGLAQPPARPDPIGPI